MTFSDIIAEIGASDLAKVLKLEGSHVRVMKARNSIPAEYWADVVALAAKRGVKGVTHESLKRLRNARFQRGEAA